VHECYNIESEDGGEAHIALRSPLKIHRGPSQFGEQGIKGRQSRGRKNGIARVHDKFIHAVGSLGKIPWLPSG
jgi:hypothetical protein